MIRAGIKPVSEIIALITIRVAPYQLVPNASPLDVGKCRIADANTELIAREHLAPVPFLLLGERTLNKPIFLIRRKVTIIKI